MVALLTALRIVSPVFTAAAFARPPLVTPRVACTVRRSVSTYMQEVVADDKGWPAAKVRDQFVEYFGTKEHKMVPSSPVVPYDDPTLLFANAGMNQFKPVFQGEASPPPATALRRAQSDTPKTSHRSIVTGLENTGCSCRS